MMFKKMMVPVAMAAVFMMSCAAGSMAMAQETQDEEAMDLQSSCQISCNQFCVTMPADVSESCDIDVNGDNEIAFFEKISHETGGGFVGSITTYEKVSDYAFIPNFRRGGEIVYPDGTKLDIVLTFPSDVQYDFNSEESTARYHLIADAMDEIAASIIASGDGTFVPQSEVDNTAVYDETLKKLCEDLREKKDQEALEADGFSYMYAYSYDDDQDPASAFGYAFVDICGTGYPEMVIMSNEGDGQIYDLFTQVDNEVKHVLSGAERDRFYLGGQEGYEPVYLREEASGGADLSVTNFHNLNPVTKEIDSSVSFIYDSRDEAKDPWLVDYDFEDEPETLSEEDWNQRISNYGIVMIPELTALNGAA